MKNYLRFNLVIFSVIYLTNLSVSQTTSIQNKPAVIENLPDHLVWQFKTQDQVFASPVVNNSVLYVGSLDSIFYAIDIDSGKEKWQFKTENKIFSTAVIHNQLVCFESGNTLYALNLNGEMKWQFKLYSGNVTNRVDIWDFYHSSPRIHNDIIYICTEQGLTFGVDLATGKQVFKCQTTTKEIIRTTPAIYENTIFFGDWEGVFYAYDIRNGNKIWEYDTKEDGTYSWKNAIQTSPVIYNNAVLFGGRSNSLYSLNVKTGKKNWEYSSPTDQWLIGGPAIANGTVYIGSSDQNLYHAIDADNGDLLWQCDLDCRIWGTAFIKGDDVFIGSNSFYVIDKNTGDIKSQIEFGKVNKDVDYGGYIDRRANFHSLPIVDGNKIFVGSDDGCIYAINQYAD